MPVMKKIILFLSVLITVACSSDMEQQVYTLSVDKNVIEADGRDMAVFTITDAAGNVMTTSANMGKIYFKNVKTGFNLARRSEGFTSIANGEYEFVGMCMGVMTANTVKIKAQNRRNYELYHRNVGLFKCTSVWCSACPELSARLHVLDEESAAHSVVLSCHGKFDGKQDVFAIKFGGTDLGNMMVSTFRGSGWPTLVYDLDYAHTGAGVTLSELAENIMNRRLEHPATCGLKIDNCVVENNAVKVTVSMKTSAAGNYDITAALVQDGLSYTEGFSVDGKGIHDDVLIAIQSNFMTYSSETGKSLLAGEEVTREFVFDFGTSAPGAEGLSVVAFAHRKASNSSIMDNIISVPFGQTSEYVLND